MKTKKNSYLARLLAVVGLLGAIVVLIVAINGATGSDDDESKGNKQTQNRPAKNKPKTNKKNYEVESGDTLESIASKTGIPVERIERLNPNLDPQALQVGQKIKLR